MTLINGTGEGKVLLLTAGVHPDEYLASQPRHPALSNELRPEDISGGLVIGPMANYSGFLAKKGSHIPEDGKNSEPPVSRQPQRDGGGIGSPAYHQGFSRGV